MFRAPKLGGRARTSYVVNAIFRISLEGETYARRMNVASPAARPSTRFSPAQTTVTISRRAGGWHVTDERESIGGLFVSLEAALAFVRRELVLGSSSAHIIVDSAGH